MKNNDYTKLITVGNSSYEVVMPSAIDQEKLLSRIGGQLMVAGTLASNKGWDLSKDALLAIIIRMPFEDKQMMANILLARCFKVGDNTRSVNVEDFRGNMMEWNQLLYEVLKWNYEDFFTFINVANVSKT